MERPHKLGLLVASFAVALLAPIASEASLYHVQLHYPAVSAEFDLLLDDAGVGTADGLVKVTYYRNDYKWDFTADVNGATKGSDGFPNFSFGTDRSGADRLSLAGKDQLWLTFENQYVDVKWNGSTILNARYKITAATPEPSAALVFAIGLTIASHRARKGIRPA